MLRIALALLVVVLGVLVPAGHASAHTELESTNPVDGSVVTTPVNEIALSFTAAVSLIDGGYEVLDPTGQVRGRGDPRSGRPRRRRHG